MMIPHRYFSKYYDDIDSWFEQWTDWGKGLEGALSHSLKKSRLNGIRLQPPVNVYETPDIYVVRALVPGLSREDIDLSVSGNSLTMTYERKESKGDKLVKYSRKEREIKSFNRLIRLPTEIDQDQIEAGLKNGILTISVHKSEKAKSKKISIQ